MAELMSDEDEIAYGYIIALHDDWIECSVNYKGEDVHMDIPPTYFPNDRRYADYIRIQQVGDEVVIDIVNDLAPTHENTELYLKTLKWIDTLDEKDFNRTIGKA